MCEESQPKWQPSSSIRTTITGVGIATPPTGYSQTELLEVFGIKDRRVRSLFMNSAIDRRYLTLPKATGSGPCRTETQGELLKKHRACAVEIGARAIQACLDSQNARTSEIGFLCCVTTTGFLSPGVSAFMCRELGLAADCARLDVVGMGCNAGLNALTLPQAGR